MFDMLISLVKCTVYMPLSVSFFDFVSHVNILKSWRERMTHSVCKIFVNLPLKCPKYWVRSEKCPTQLRKMPNPVQKNAQTEHLKIEWRALKMPKSAQKWHWASLGIHIRRFVISIVHLKEIKLFHSAQNQKSIEKVFFMMASFSIDTFSCFVTINREYLKTWIFLYF